jgi:hypothetical protein
MSGMDFVAIDFETGKTKKAVALRAKGQRIEVMTEGQLFELLT